MIGKHLSSINLLGVRDGSDRSVPTFCSIKLVLYCINHRQTTRSMSFGRRHGLEFKVHRRDSGVFPFVRFCFNTLLTRNRRRDKDKSLGGPNLL